MHCRQCKRRSDKCASRLVQKDHKDGPICQTCVGINRHKKTPQLLGRKRPRESGPCPVISAKKKRELTNSAPDLQLVDSPRRALVNVSLQRSEALTHTEKKLCSLLLRRDKQNTSLRPYQFIVKSCGRGAGKPWCLVHVPRTQTPSHIAHPETRRSRNQVLETLLTKVAGGAEGAKRQQQALVRRDPSKWEEAGARVPVHLSPEDTQVLQNTHFGGKAQMRDFLKWCKKAGVQLRVASVQKTALAADAMVWKPEVKLIEHTVKKHKSFWVLVPSDFTEVFSKIHAGAFCPPAYTVYRNSEGHLQAYRVYTVALDHGGGSYKFTMQPLSVQHHNSGLNTQVASFPDSLLYYQCTP